MKKSTGWMIVKAASDLTTVRELEVDAFVCHYCGIEASQYRRFWSYDNTGLAFCKKDHWEANHLRNIVRGNIPTPAANHPLFSHIPSLYLVS